MIKNCAICGKKIDINSHQKRKKICEKCAYEVKKERNIVSYHKRTNPNTIRAKNHIRKLEMLNNLIKNA